MYVCFPLTIHKMLFTRLQDPTCLLLPPKSPNRPAECLTAGIAAALATRFDADIRLVKNYLKSADIVEWGKVRRIDSDAGDTMHASSLVPKHEDGRDATYVRVRR
jgi:hypothetical protein